jgi:hypothetical protein
MVLSTRTHHSSSDILALILRILSAGVGSMRFKIKRDRRSHLKPETGSIDLQRQSHGRRDASQRDS